MKSSCFGKCLSILPGKRGSQNPSQAVCRPPWLPLSPNCRCTLCPKPESRFCVPAPLRGPRRGSGRRLTESTGRHEVAFQLLSLSLFCFGSIKMAAHSFAETHVGNVALDSCILLVAAAQSVAVEAALGQRLLKARALHLVHVNRPNACRQTHQTPISGTKRTTLKS